MKKISVVFLLLASLLLILCGCATEKETEPKFFEIARNHEYLNDGVVTKADNYSYTYNDVGLVIFSEHHQNGLLLSQESYEYDEFGNLVKVITESNGTDESSELKYNYTMDEEGHILRDEMYQNGELRFVHEFTYDKKGNELTQEQTLFSKNEESNWRKYTKDYNRKGELIRETLHWNFNEEYIIWDYEDERCIRQTVYEKDTDKIVEYFVNTYDEKGNLIRESQYDAADNLKCYTEYTWDETGRVQTIKDYSADGTLQSDFDVLTFDEYGNEIMHERYSDGELYWKTYHIYEQLLIA